MKWRYVKDDNESSSGWDCGWVDYVQWTASPEPPEPPGQPPVPPAQWQTAVYTYDPSGRRIAKSVDNNYTVKYCYDGDHVIAEYDGENSLLRKYVYGPRVDEPVCMINVQDNNSVCYYHFDGLGSVIALSDPNGDTIQTYEYSVYGEVAAADVNHPNPIMFTGRWFDQETGLYYYRARYYNPCIGRFLQTDLVGYEDGMNLYTYCANNPVNKLDPSGCAPADEASVPPWHGPPYHIQEKPCSCAAATIINMLIEIRGDEKWEIPSEKDVRKVLERLMGRPNPTGNDIGVWGEWGATGAIAGIGCDVKYALQFLNLYLSGVDRTKKYKRVEHGEWSVESMKEYVTKGPVFYVLGSTPGPWHYVMLRNVEEDTTKTLQWGRPDPRRIRADWYWTVLPDNGWTSLDTQWTLKHALSFGSLETQPILVPRW